MEGKLRHAQGMRWLRAHSLLLLPQSLTVEEGCRLARENAKDIIACGACAGVLPVCLWRRVVGSPGA